MSATDTTTSSPPIPVVSGGDGPNGHLDELRTDPIGLLERVRAECGDVGQFLLVDRPVTLLTDADANETFFRAPDEVLDQGEAYPFMTPVFGEGVVFDASPEERRKALHNQALRDKFMRGHATTIAAEVERSIAEFDTSGTIDLLDYFAELTIYTSSSCLIGPKFREQLDRRFADLFYDLECGTDAVAFVDPYADIESFHRRDAARAELVTLIEAIMETRRQAPKPERDDMDLLDVMMSIMTPEGTPHFSADIVTGMFISMMFAGHHTTSTTASWTMIELLRNPDAFARVQAEIDGLAADGAEISYQALRDAPVLEAAIKETLRLHPPLILLLRVAKEPVEAGGFTIPEGSLVGASPSVSNRIEHAFADSEVFDIDRYLDGRQEDLTNPWNWIPFGAGRHRCVGAAFAMMQLKAIFMSLLGTYRFEAAQPLDSYRNDVSKMVIQLQQPALITYHERTDAP